MPFVKIRFTSKIHGATAGLVLSAELVKQATASELSRYFPYTECRKMERLEVSPPYDTWNAAFLHTFDGAKS